jgi:hypothetical protein
MKNRICSLLLIFVATLLGAQDNPNLVFEIITATPKSGKMGELTEKMKAHNDAFHADGPHGARVYSINTGHETGKLMWIMGPGTWSGLEDRPAGDEHSSDWEGNVVPLLEDDVHVTYYSFSRELSHFPKDFDLKYLFVQYVDLAPQSGYRYVELLKKAKKVYQENFPDEAYGVYWNAFGDSKEGRDLMLVFFFDDMSWMDRDNSFASKFQEVHGGAGSWVNFWRELDDSVLGIDRVLAQYLPAMGGSSSTVVSAERQ